MRPSKLLFLLLLMFVGKMYAQNFVPCVVVEKNDGTKTEFRLSSTPRISFANNIVTITTTDTSVEQSASDIVKVYLSEMQEVNTIVEANKTNVQVFISNEAITIYSLQPNSQVALYAIDGSRIDNQKVSNDGTVIIPFFQHPHGIYLIKSDKQTFKIIKK